MLTYWRIHLELVCVSQLRSWCSHCQLSILGSWHDRPVWTGEVDSHVIYSVVGENRLVWFLWRAAPLFYGCFFWRPAHLPAWWFVTLMFHHAPLHLTLRRICLQENAVKWVYVTTELKYLLIIATIVTALMEQLHSTVVVVIKEHL